jgi:hypothetical protein
MYNKQRQVITEEKNNRIEVSTQYCRVKSVYDKPINLKPLNNEQRQQ